MNDDELVAPHHARGAGHYHRLTGGRPRFSQAWTDAAQRQQDTDDVLERVSDERGRQFRKHGDQRHLPNGTGGWYAGVLARQARATTDANAADGTVTFADVLREEVLEALAESDDEALLEELVQVAAVAVQWVEAIVARTPRRDPGVEALDRVLQITNPFVGIPFRSGMTAWREAQATFLSAAAIARAERELDRELLARRLYEGEFPSPEDPRSPDCIAGKCRACAGDAWDEEIDARVPCPCACHDQAAAAAGGE